MNYNIVSEDTGNAFCEVYDIINNMENELQNKIPKTFVNFIKENRSKNYMVNIDYTISINKQPLLKETRTILALIYRDYLCDKSKRQELIANDVHQLNELAEINKAKYNVDLEERAKLIDKKRHDIIKEKENSKNIYLTEVKEEKWYIKLLSNFKKIILKLFSRTK